MNCEEVLDRLSAWCDDELSDDERAVVEQHVDHCNECRLVGEELASLGASLRDSFQIKIEPRERVVAGFLESVPDVESSAVQAPHSQRRSSDWGWYLSLLVSAAAGFLLAWFVFSNPAGRDRPQQAEHSNPDGTSGQKPDRYVGNERAPDRTGPDRTGPDRTGVDNENQLAVVNVSVGQIESRESDGDDWQTLPDIATFACPPSSEIRTRKEALCEVELPNGNIVRMDESSRVKFVDNDQIEVMRGQVWCQAAKDGEMSVSSLEPKPGTGTQSKTSWTARCVGNTCVVTTVKGGETSVFTSKGSIDFLSEMATTSLKSGEVVRIVDGKIVPAEEQFDPIAATRWIHAILKEKGPDDPEFNERIREMLVRTGYAKVNFLYENEIRDLGQHAVLPLMEYLASQQFQKDRNNRRRAAKLASDLAPSWAIPDLIERITDHDPDVAATCGTALVRLAGTDLRSPVSSWGDDMERRKEIQGFWNDWWKLRKDQMPKRPMKSDLST